MNAVQPIPPAPSGTNVAPTLGGMLGSAAGLIVAGKLGLNPLDPVGGSLVASIAAGVTAVFHWLGKKTGIPGLA